MFAPCWPSQAPEPARHEEHPMKARLASLTPPPAQLQQQQQQLLRLTLRLAGQPWNRR